MPPQPKPQDPLIGLRLDGRYVIKAPLGRGGMGVVYEGVHEQLGRSVAIKVLGAGIATEEIVVKRFLREARIASGLGHGNIVDVSDLGTVPDGRPYLVMPKIDGISFAKLLEKRGPQPPGRVVELLKGVASALDLVHAKGLVHRDVKPENLMYVVRADGSETVMLMDFGIATLIASDAARLTAEGVVCGTPAYLAPESARGEDADHRADVYALATVAFELITGSLPFDAENQLKILPMKAFRDPPRLAAIAGRPFPEAVEEVIARGLSRDPDHRYRSAGEFVTSLELVLEQGNLRPGEPPAMTRIEGISSTPPPMPSRGPTESLEMPLGSSDQFALEEALSTDSLAPSPSGGGAPEQRAHATPLHSSTELPRARTPLYALGAGLLLVLGGSAYALLGSGSPAPARLPAPLPAAVAAPGPAPVKAAAPEVEAPAPAPAPVAAPAAAAEPEPAAPVAAPPARREPPRAKRPAQRSAPAPAAVEPAPAAAPTADELLREASQTLLRGHLARAAELYEQATRRDPRSAAAYRGLGLTSERLGQKAAAIKAYRRALDLAPTGPQADTVRERLARLQ